MFKHLIPLASAEWLGIVGITLGAAILAILVVTMPMVLLAGGTPKIELAIEDGNLVVRLGKRDAVFAFRRRFAIPLSTVTEVRTMERKAVPRHGLRLPGTEIPGFIRAGSYGRGHGREFWNVRKGETVLVIDATSAAPYVRTVLEVEDPEGQAARIRAALEPAAG
jgi:hypothetical protein